jgi:SAM-dependent methyltransferase
MIPVADAVPGLARDRGPRRLTGARRFAELPGRSMPRAAAPRLTVRRDFPATRTVQDAQFSLHAAIEDRHWWFVGRRSIVKRLLERVVPPRPDALVIDVGCGTGANVAALSPAYRCLGLDASPRAIELARARYAGVEFACEDDLTARADRFGAAACVLLMDVLEHVEDDFALLSQVLSLVPEGAHVLITVPADASLWSVHDETFGHHRRYDAARLRATWEGLPVDERLLSPYNARLFPIIKAVRVVSRRRERAAGAEGTDFIMPPPLVNRWLESFFAGEAGALERHIDRPGAPHARGASLVAILRKGREPIAPRRKPPGVAPDTHPARREGGREASTSESRSLVSSSASDRLCDWTKSANTITRHAVPSAQSSMTVHRA